MGLHLLGLHTAPRRHGGPQALRPSGRRASRAPLGPRSAARLPLRAAAKDTGAEPRQSSLQPSGRGSLCAGGLSCGRWRFVCQQPGGRRTLDGRDRRQDLAAARAARPRHLDLTLRARAAAAPARTRAPQNLSDTTRQIHPRCMRARCTCVHAGDSARARQVVHCTRTAQARPSCLSTVPARPRCHPYPGATLTWSLPRSRCKRAAACRRPAASRVAGAPPWARPQPHTRRASWRASAAPPPRRRAAAPRRRAADPRHRARRPRPMPRRAPARRRCAPMLPQARRRAAPRTRVLAGRQRTSRTAAREITTVRVYTSMYIVYFDALYMRYYRVHSF